MMPDEYFKKNVEMWEKFTSSYMDTMFGMVEKTMNQSQAFKEQMDKVVNDAVSNQMDATMKSLDLMQSQMEEISKKMDAILEKMEVK